MPRTTIYIDAPLLADLRRLQKKDGQSLGALVSALLAEALEGRRKKTAPRREFVWKAQPMQARIDLQDKDAILEILDRREAGGMKR